MNERPRDLIDAFDKVNNRLTEIQTVITTLRNQIIDQADTIGRGEIILSREIVIDPINPPIPPAALGKCHERWGMLDTGRPTLKNVTTCLGAGLSDCAKTIDAAGTWLDGTLAGESQG